MYYRFLFILLFSGTIAAQAKPEPEIARSTQSQKLNDIAFNQRKSLLEKETIDISAPGFTLSDLTGKKVSLSDYRGKVVEDYKIEALPAKVIIDRFGKIRLLKLSGWEKESSDGNAIEELMAMIETVSRF